MAKNHFEGCDEDKVKPRKKPRCSNLKRSASNRFFGSRCRVHNQQLTLAKIISVTQESLAFNHNEHCFVRGSHEMSDINSKEAYLSIVQPSKNWAIGEGILIFFGVIKHLYCCGKKNMIYGWSIVVLQIVFSGPEAGEDIADVAIERASILWSNALIVRVRLDVFTKRVPTLFLKNSFKQNVYLLSLFWSQIFC